MRHVCQYQTKRNGGAMPDFMGRWWFWPLAIVWIVGTTQKSGFLAAARQNR